MTRLQAGLTGFDPRHRNFSSAPHGTTRSPDKRVSEINPLELETDHLPVFIVDVTNAWNCVSIWAVSLKMAVFQVVINPKSHILFLFPSFLRAQLQIGPEQKVTLCTNFTEQRPFVPPRGGAVHRISATLQNALKSPEIDTSQLFY